jgi:hypothetical protein
MTPEQLKRAAQTALCVINACNASGVIFDLPRKLQELVEDVGTADKLPQHPITIIYVQAIENVTHSSLIEPIENNRPFGELVKEFAEYMHIVCKYVHNTDDRNRYEPVQTYVGMLLYHVPDARGYKYGYALQDCEAMAAGRIEQWSLPTNIS